MTLFAHRGRGLARTLVLAALALAACAPSFTPRRFTDLQALYRASLEQLERRRFENAEAGFERLTQELPARDSLLAPSFFHLARAHYGQEEYLLAARNFQRLTELFPLDTLADDALLRAARSYAALWEKPTLDPEYGEVALSTLESFVSLFPQSPLLDEAQALRARLRNMLATKDYETGIFYLRRRAYDSAILYFRDVVEQFPETPRARDAYLRLAEAYREINYREERRDVCATLHERYPSDGEVREICGPPPASPAAGTSG